MARLCQHSEADVLMQDANECSFFMGQVCCHFFKFVAYFCTPNDRINLHSRPHLINVELLDQIQISALSPQMPLGHRLHALFLQAVHHIIERILVWQCCKSLGKRKREIKPIK